MTTVVSYLKEWQQALQNEINYLKKFGSNKYLVSNGRLLSTDGSFSYYFETSTSLRIPVGSTIRLEWGGMSQNGRILSSEGIGVIIALEQSFGDLISEATLYHDPWELLEQLIERLDEIKKDKQKRLRVKKLMDPSMPATHPVEKIKSTVHEVVLRSKYNPVTFVWGPPGTGKTYTLARTAANKYFQEKRVLILSHSNQAVDVLIGELSDFIKKKNRFREGDVLRYGFSTSDQLADREAVTTSELLEKQDPGLAEEKVILLEERKHLKQDIARSFSKRDTNQLLELETKIARVLEKIRQKEIQFVEDAFVVGTTLAKAASDPVIFEKTFDVVIVDEVSMAYVPQAAFAAALGKRVIICGDFKQLPPIAASRDPLVTKWLKEDIFHRAGIVDWVKDGRLHPHLFLLKEQRRMHPDISAFTNQYIYQSLVGDHESVWKSRNKIVESAPFPSRSSVLVDTSYTGAHCITERTSQSRMNIWQVLLSFQLIHESYVSGLRSIGYVTPYRAQAQLMELILEDLYEKERRLADIIAATVHRFQGSERDVMIFDTVEGAPQTRAGMLVTGKDSERLINVAITRTRGKFIHVSNQAFIRKHVFQGKTLRQLVDHQVKKQQLVETKDIGTWIRHQHPQLQWMHARRLEKVFQDFDSVRESIVLSLPAQTRLTAEWEEKLKSRSKSVKLTVVSNEQWQNLHPEQRIAESLPFPFIIIDEALLWLGLPLEGAKEIQPPYVAARLESVKVSNYLLSQIITKE
ncbi:DNA helicase [Bacillus sp. AFS076308]|uniref:DEAD/DEAH box helicase n=1 Tax=unclassified Bacillus (in: firmicutes) TaxID=185979 RepID=UPI000BF5A68E|nr:MULTISPECIES: AAA domain-containing protein [unclassified Bacillus (in: firmicutes)]PFN96084.1 DNA helicase [Bacillus sp. AFS076308]PGV55970.1 DNA helicase [Bacillus sp. AFS037270]